MEKEKLSGSVKFISTILITVFLGSCVMTARPIGEPEPGVAPPPQPMYEQSQPPEEQQPPPEEQPQYQSAPAPEYEDYNQNYTEAPEPPPVEYTAPPDVVVLPDTNDVYVVPNAQVDIYFWNGFWWRPWAGRWYRSQYYDRDWVYYNQVPSFYYDVDPGWRGYYRDHSWQGHPWYYQRIPDRELQQNWRNWHNDQYWERQRTWNVRNYRPPSQQQMQVIRYQRERQYQQRPDVQRYQNQMRQQQRPHQRPAPQEQRYQQQRPQQRQVPQEQRYQQQRPQQGQRPKAQIRQQQRPSKGQGQQRQQQKKENKNEDKSREQ